jgi:hypothetical protein
MKNTNTLGALLLTSFLFASSAVAGTLTNIRFDSNSNQFQNDTVPNGNSPLGFTLLGSTAEPFLNAADSSVSLGFGSYYAITSGSGLHLGAGNISFRLDNTTNFTQSVTFPSNTPAGVIFATFNLPGGDIVQFSTTGIFANRVQIAADQFGLVPDGNPDPFFLMTYAAATNGSPVPEPSSIALGLCGLAAIAWYRRQN